MQRQEIVASCPHCFSILKNEYPQFGGSFEVAHHSQLIIDLITQGKLRVGGMDNLKPDDMYPMILSTGRVLYHWHGGR